MKNTMKKPVAIPVEKLRPFDGHPFKVKDDDEMNTLIESVQTQGILSPLIVRPIENTDEYEVISGHRRLHAAQKAGITEVPALIYALDRDAAAIAVVDSNLHREHILPSEKAFAYKLKMEALSHQGKRTDLTSDQVGPKLTAATISETDSASQVKRYIRLTYLIPEFLEKMDEGEIALSVGVELSFLDEQNQRAVLEQWSIVPNAQEAIIDENTWLRVQELRKNKRRPTATGKTSLFSGLVFCADCGSKLHFCAAKSLKANQEFFRCANYKSGRGECAIHYIRNVVLEQIVSVTVSDLADFVACHESFFLQMIGKQQSAGKDQNIRSVKSDIAAGKHRIDEIDRLIAKLYEDNFAGKLSDERYSRMAAKYEKEQAELLQSVSTKEKELAELERESVDIRLLLAGLREYSSMETLTPEVVNKIIKRIEVHNSETVNGHKRVGVDIYFTGVGLVDLATIKEMLAIAELSRP